MYTIKEVTEPYSPSELGNADMQRRHEQEVGPPAFLLLSAACRSSHQTRSPDCGPSYRSLGYHILPADNLSVSRNKTIVYI
jgi:hypothetical protein